MGWLWSNGLLGASKWDYSFSIYRKDTSQVTLRYSDKAVLGIGNYNWNCFLTDPCGILTHFWILQPADTNDQTSNRWNYPGQTASQLCATALTKYRPQTQQPCSYFFPLFQLLTKLTTCTFGTQTLQGNIFQKQDAFLPGAICCYCKWNQEPEQH